MPYNAASHCCKTCNVLQSILYSFRGCIGGKKTTSTMFRERKIILFVGLSTCSTEFPWWLKSPVKPNNSSHGVQHWAPMISSGLGANADCWEDWPAQQHLGWLESHDHNPTTMNLKMSAESTELVSVRLIGLTPSHSNLFFMYFLSLLWLYRRNRPQVL